MSCFRSEAIKRPGQVPGGVDGLSSGKVAAQLRPRWITELLVEDICMERPVILPTAMPDAYSGTSEKLWPDMVDTEVRMTC
jgi:hypothetical protein